MADPGQNPTPAASSTPEGPTTPPDAGARWTDKDVDKFKGDARKDARQAAINELLQKAGADSIDDVLAGYQGFKTVEEETKTEADRLKDQLGKLQPQAERATKLEEFVKSYVETQRIGVPEYVTALLDNMDPLQQAAWLNEHKAELVSDPEPQPIRRSPDASVRPAKSGDPEQQMGAFLGQILSR